MHVEFDYDSARRFLAEKERKRQAVLDERFDTAWADLISKAVLLGQLEETKDALGSLKRAYEKWVREDFAELGRRPATASLLSDILEHYYTALETFFLRVSRFFESKLSTEKWHQDLPEKMLLEVPGLRPNVVSRVTFEILRELMRFRHFRRYYYEQDYDWDRLEFLRKKLEELFPLLDADLSRFLSFLTAL